MGRGSDPARVLTLKTRLDENCTSEKKYKVFGDSLEQASTCSCGIFNITGILCRHAIKVLDMMSIKSLPAQYVLKRWTVEHVVGQYRQPWTKYKENP